MADYSGFNLTAAIEHGLTVGCLDYTLNNPDTLTKYKTAAQISHKVLEAVTGTIRMLLRSLNQ